MRKPQTSPVRDVILVATNRSTETNPVGMTQMNAAEMMNRNEKLYTTARLVYFDENASIRRCVIPKGIK
jgi:hypothetical protein